MKIFKKLCDFFGQSSPEVLLVILMLAALFLLVTVPWKVSRKLTLEACHEWPDSPETSKPCFTVVLIVDGEKLWWKK